MTREQRLRDALRSIAPDRAQEIREAYYKAVEGPQSLADALETTGSAEPVIELLIREHLLACEALGVMRRSELGRVLWTSPQCA